jgi:dTDP-glucose pyrophosphorylase
MIQSLESVCIRENGTLFEALEVLQKGRAGIALVQSADGRLLGILTDGDIRRALLEHASLSDPVAPFVSRDIKTVSPQAPRAEVLDLMQALQIHQVPVVDEAGYVKGLHLLHEILGAVDRPHWAVIMAGGRGVRLGDLTRNTPKPMLKVAGRPILERLILHLVGLGIRKIFLSVHYLAEVIEEHFGDGSRFGCSIEYLHEDQPLGTGGALSLLPTVPDHSVLVCNGDLITQADIDAMIRFHEAAPFDLTVGVRDYSYQIPFGCAEIDGDRLVSMSEKPSMVHQINAGIYLVSPGVLKMVPQTYFPITELIQSCLDGGKRVGAWRIEDDWIDVGQRHELDRARNGAP